MALESVKDWQELNGKTEKERDKKFLEAFRSIKKPFTVETKKIGRGRVDLDARSALELFKIAGVNIGKINKAKSGDYIDGSINLDTGNKEGLVVQYPGQESGDPYTGQALTVFFDHHAMESKRGGSATKFVYDTLRKMNLLEQDIALEKAVELVNQEDNRLYPNEEKYYKDSPNTMLGLVRFVEFKNLYQFFKDGLSPVQKLTPEQIEKYGLTKANDYQNRIVEKTEPMFKELEKNGFVVNSKKYGKILVDINGDFASQAGGFVGAKAMGAESYVIWSPANRSFFLSSSKSAFPDKFLPQGERKRETMWVKDDTGPLNMNLNEILATMTNNKNYRLSKKMNEALKKAEKEAQDQKKARAQTA